MLKNVSKASRDLLWIIKVRAVLMTLKIQAQSSLLDLLQAMCTFNTLASVPHL